MPTNFKEVLKREKKRRLKGDDVQPLLEVTSVPGLGSDPAKLELTDWQLTDVTEFGFSFKFYYKEPIEVSQNESPDMIKVRFNVEQIKDIYG